MILKIFSSEVLFSDMDICEYPLALTCMQPTSNKKADNLIVRSISLFLPEEWPLSVRSSVKESPLQSAVKCIASFGLVNEY